MLDIIYEIWFEQNEEALIEQYYESGACYDSGLEWFIKDQFEKEIER
jgi:hypothetical protein